MISPRTTRLDRTDTHRLVSSRHRADDESVLVRIADDDAQLGDIFELDNATNDRLLAESDLLPGIGIGELVFEVPRYRIVNAAFCHAHPEGGRFNGPDRGAWYASFELETAQAEVIFHKSVALAEIDCFDDSITYDDYLSDFHGAFHDVRDDGRFEACLAQGSYLASQTLAADLLGAGSAGIVYPSVRRPRGTNLVCFRPALVANVRLGATWRFTWQGEPTPLVELEAAR